MRELQILLSLEMLLEFQLLLYLQLITRWNPCKEKALLPLQSLQLYINPSWTMAGIRNTTAVRKYSKELGVDLCESTVRLLEINTKLDKGEFFYDQLH